MLVLLHLFAVLTQFAGIRPVIWWYFLIAAAAAAAMLLSSEMHAVAHTCEWMKNVHTQHMYPTSPA